MGPADRSPGPGRAPGTDRAGTDDGTSPGPGAGAGVGKADPSATDWYRQMLRERFYAQWNQPTSPFDSGQNYRAVVRLCIERDGRVSRFSLVQPSGLVPMDESVLEAAGRVRQIDPPPDALLQRGVYELNIEFVREN